MTDDADDMVAVAEAAPRIAAADPFRRLAIACAQIVAAGDHVRLDHWNRADEAYQAIRFNGLEDIQLYRSQRFLMDAYALVKNVMGWARPEARELLWVTVKCFGLAQSAHHDKGTPEAEARYWWKERP